MAVKRHALVPVTGQDGDIRWQDWTYGELTQHLNNDLQLDTSAVPPIPTPVWNPISFYGSNWHRFVSATTEWGAPSYTVDAFNNVWFTGLVAPIAAYAYNAVSADVFQLPGALIPNRTVTRMVFGQDSTASYFIARMDVAGAGSVTYTPGEVRLVANLAGANNGAAGYLSLHRFSYALGEPA